MSTDGSGGGGDWLYHATHPEWHYLYDGDVLMAVFDSSGNVRQFYVNGSGGAVAAYGSNSDNCRYYFVKDQVGSTRVVVKDTGDVVEYINYHPFDKIRESWASYDEPLQFTGKERDKYRTFDYT